jgi:two-component system chemotaxis response regulator CheY
VVLTTESETAKKQAARSAGATAWIVKPFRPEQLAAVVQKVPG